MKEGRPRLTEDDLQKPGRSLQTKPQAPTKRTHVLSFRVEAYRAECGHDVDGWHSIGDVPWPLEDFCSSTAAI